MNSYIGRQPIFDRNVQIFAYELLFRSSAQATGFTGENADQATSRIIMESFHTMGVDVITGGKPAFINFTSNLLLEGIATLFPKELLVVEILEDVQPTPEIVQVCQDLREAGYTVALDDFVYHTELQPLIELCNIIKFDFLLSSPEEIKMMLAKMDVGGKQLLAEKVETREIFDIAVSMGFTLFQGYFFSKPVTLSHKSIEPLKMSYISLLKEISVSEYADVGRLANVIRNDVALSYKLLKMINSPYYGLRNKVTDIRHALSMLGAKETRKWISLLSMIGLSNDKPDELIKMSMIRGRFMEGTGKACKIPCTPDDLFLTGLFSLMDVLMGGDMEDALGGMKLPTGVTEALLEHKGKLYDLLQLVISLETGDFDAADKLAVSLNLNVEQVSDVYIKVVRWCNAVSF